MSNDKDKDKNFEDTIVGSEDIDGTMEGAEEIDDTMVGAEDRCHY